jgi:hypothetical protein
MREAKQKPQWEKLSLVVEADIRTALSKWAEEEDRPVGNLIRRIVTAAVEHREGAVAA